VKLLLDECVDQHLRSHITGHDVFTVGFMGWAGVKNGELLGRAAAADFDAMLTTDHSIRHQQNLATLPLAVVWLSVPSNDIDDLIPLIPKLLAVLQTLSPRTFATVP
jgi:hypothetical protein